MQKLLFMKVEFWVLLLILLLGFFASIGFGAAVLDAERGSARLGQAGTAALAIAEVPDTIVQLAKRSQAMVAINPNRFKELPAGWQFTPGATKLPGYLLLSRYDGDASRHVVELVSLDNGATEFTWSPDAEALLDGAPRTSQVATFTNWDNTHYRAVHPLLLADGNLIIKDHQSYLMRIDACARKVWRQDAALAHHSTEGDGAGGFWVPALIEPQTIANVAPDFREDALMHVDADGNIISLMSLDQILLRHGMDWALSNTGSRVTDPLHLNDIQPVLTDGPYWKAGDLFLSIRFLSMALLYRPSTDEIIWSKQGPWLNQHDIDILDDHRIGIFDNHSIYRGKYTRVDGANRVTIYDFATDEVIGPWNEGLTRHEVKTLSEGLFTLLPDGTLMVEEENSGRLMFLNDAGDAIASYVNKGSSGKTFRLGWSRYIDQSLGDKVLASVKGNTCVE